MKEERKSINAGALFSEGKRHRYYLWRIWDSTLPFIAFIGLNPSTADEIKDDATIRRVKRFAELWGYGGVYMLNCFPFITAYPEQIELDRDSWDSNDRHIQEISEKCIEIVFAWGNFGIVKQEVRDLKMIKLFPNAKCLGKNKNGSPKHPLYIAKNQSLIKF